MLPSLINRSAKWVRATRDADLVGEQWEYGDRDTRSLPMEDDDMDESGGIYREAGRRHPVRGVLLEPGRPTIVFLTVCTKNRGRWLAQSQVQKELVGIWKEVDSWLVGEYVLMPDHLHLFCAPHDLGFTLQQWVSHWKRRFSCLHLPDTGSWQRDFWDTRLRRGENYTEKWHYVRENPVRAGLVKNVDAWPFQGRLHVLRW